MLSADESRIRFFKTLHDKHKFKSILDCACGTGSDVIMFKSFIDKVSGSDLSGAMLEVAEIKIKKTGLDIELKKADFRHLELSGLIGYDATVCLSSSICEVHSNEDVMRAIKSMFNSLNDKGVLIIDQGQSDAMMKSRPRFIPVTNNRDISRLFVIDYSENSNDFITVNMCDMEHTMEGCSFSHNPFNLRIRLIDEWKDLLHKAGMDTYEIYGSWEMDKYDRKNSKRLIIKAQKK